MIKLGGNIELEGFEALEPAKLVVIKKVVGNYARQMADSGKGFERLAITITQKGSMFDIRASAVFNGKETSKDVADSKLFYGLDNVLAGLLNGIK